MGSPIGATFCTVTCVFGVRPMSSRRRRSAPLSAHGSLSARLSDGSLSSVISVSPIAPNAKMLAGANPLSAYKNTRRRGM